LTFDFVYDILLLISKAVNKVSQTRGSGLLGNQALFFYPAI